MNSQVSHEIQEVIESVHCRPAISIIMPFEPQISLQTELTHSLKIAVDKVKEEVVEKFPHEIARFVLNKLQTLIQNLDFDSSRKSIAIFVSPVFSKVIYMNIPVDEKIMIGNSFEIRDLIANKKQPIRFLVLLLSSQQNSIYLGNDGTFLLKIETDQPANAAAYYNDIPEPVLNFSDPTKRKEIMLDKFLHQVDLSLEQVLSGYHLPVFVLGADRVIGHFKQITRHAGDIVEYIHGNYEHTSNAQLKRILEPHISILKDKKQQSLLKQLELAAGQKRLATGINDVWHHAALQRGQLLVVERNYAFAASQGDSIGSIHKTEKPANTYSYISDAVDEVIEKVLEFGGDVEFVDNNLLSDFQHIALIKYF